MYDELEICKKDLSLCLSFAKDACIGGKSNIHTDKDQRQQKLLMDNFIGQVGTLAGCIALYGEEIGREEYIKSRTLANKNPYKGDKGQDIVGENIDIKCSYMRSSSDPTTYNVLIRPREKHPNWVYIQTLAKYTKTETDKIMKVYIMGWVSTEDLPKSVEWSGPFKGAYKMSVQKLKSMNLLNKNDSMKKQ